MPQVEDEADPGAADKEPLPWRGRQALVTAVINPSIHHGHGRWLCEFQDDDSRPRRSWIIMGQISSTTITGQLIALDAGPYATSQLLVVLILFAGKRPDPVHRRSWRGLESCLSAWI